MEKDEKMSINSEESDDSDQTHMSSVSSVKIVKNIGDPWMNWKNFIPDFLIDNELHKKLTFRETLLICRFDDKHASTPPRPVGGLCLDVQSARGNPIHHRVSTNRKRARNEFKTKKFLVHVSSQFEYFGGNGGSTITSWVDRSLHTLEEQRTEFLRHERSKKEQTLYLNNQDDHYYLRHDKKHEIYYPNSIQNLIQEGANFILMRYLAVVRFFGRFELSTTYINGDLCRNIYDCEGPSSGIVNDTKLDVCKIYRTIIERCGISHESVTLLTLQGQILKHEWKGASIILQLNPLARVTNDTPSGNLRLRPDNKQDIELLSRYLDAKTLSEKTIESYLDDYRKIRNLIADYVQVVLELKPDDILEFTSKYFLSFAPELWETSEYYEKVDDEDESMTSERTAEDEFYV